MVGSVENLMPWELIVLSYYHLILFIKDLPMVPVAFLFTKGSPWIEINSDAYIMTVEGSHDSEQSGNSLLKCACGKQKDQCGGMFWKHHLGPQEAFVCILNILFHSVYKCTCILHPKFWFRKYNE